MSSEYLIIKVNDISYAIDIFDIQSIIEYKPSTRIVGSPEEVLGLIHHLDKLWSVIDLKKVYHKEFIDIELGENGNTIESSRSSKIILLIDQKNGLLIEEILGIETVDVSDIKMVEIEKKAYYVININGDIACIIDLASIIRGEFNRKEYEVVA